MEKKIMIEKNTKKDSIEIWEYNKKGFYNFKEYLPLNKTSLSNIKKQYKKYTIIDKEGLLNHIQIKEFQTDTGLIILI